MSKPLSVDNTRDTGVIAAELDLLSSRPSEVPVNGFEWVEGLRALTRHRFFPGRFLISRGGPTKDVDVPEDLYLKFSELTREPEAIINFANTYGQLRLLGIHFHRKAESAAEEGESVADWYLEIRRVKDALDLWWLVQGNDLRAVRRFLEPIGPNRKKGATWALALPTVHVDDPLEKALRILINTINMQLSPAIRWDQACLLPDCNFSGFHPWTDSTYAYVRRLPGRQPVLVTASSNLIKAIWLQFATAVAGQKRVKKCAAPDCGRYMDVTSSPRPGACRMHPHCEERLKKKRYREGKKKDQSTRATEVNEH